MMLLFLLASTCPWSDAYCTRTNRQRDLRSTTAPRSNSLLAHQDDNPDPSPHKQSVLPAKPDEEEQYRGQTGRLLNRRNVLAVLAASSSAALFTVSPNSADASTLEAEPLEQLALGEGQWSPLNQQTEQSQPQQQVTVAITASPAFVTYLTRFLLNFDMGVHEWWEQVQHSYSLLGPEQQSKLSTQKFGCLARSIQQGLGSSNIASSIELWDLLVNRYGSHPDAPRQIALLFALLPSQLQPTSRLQSALKSQPQPNNSLVASAVAAAGEPPVTDWDAYFRDPVALLPPPYQCQLAANGQSVVIVPDSFPLRQLQLDIAFTVDEEPNNSSANPFGPLAGTPLIRELPAYSPQIYTLFGVSGATGCALTHSVVIPLDVVKTRAQTNPLEEGSNMVGAAFDIVRNEGIQALLLGAQATIAGYFWYGLSVYPSYTFFKRYLTLEMLPPDIATVHANDIALLAGALAAVVASMGLTPIEAARIRVVAEPEKYRPMGLLGTLQEIASEDATLGWQNLYAGLPSLLTRQVIFGSVKFLAFERACEFIFAIWPFLRELTWTSLTVSLVAGGFSGALSSVVSQPADSLLTFVAQNSNSTGSKDGGSTMGLLEGCRIMIEKDGPGSLFRGLGSRCVWAGSIIAGQFLLYDVFRTYFHVSTDDLSQVYQVVVGLPTVS